MVKHVGPPAPVHLPGDIVYLTTDVDKSRRIVTGIMWRGSAWVYGLTRGAEHESWHYGYEIQNERP